MAELLYLISNIQPSRENGRRANEASIESFASVSGISFTASRGSRRASPTRRPRGRSSLDHTRWNRRNAGNPPCSASYAHGRAIWLDAHRRGIQPTKHVYMHAIFRIVPPAHAQSIRLWRVRSRKPSFHVNRLTQVFCRDCIRECKAKWMQLPRSWIRWAICRRNQHRASGISG